MPPAGSCGGGVNREMMHSCGKTDKGRYRAENQDAFRIMPRGDGLLAVVCDGMGGAAAGRLAAEMAVDKFIAVAGAGLDEPEADAGELLRQAVDAANRHICDFAAASDEYAGMGTTLVGAWIRGGTAVIASVGDSRAYRVTEEGIAQITKDHSLVQQMVDIGLLTAAQARRHPRRNIITRAVGSEPYVTCDVFTLPVQPGDVFLLCTDGLTNGVEDEAIREIILAAPDLDSACGTLLERAAAGGSRDNITALLLSEERGGEERG